MNKNDFPVHSDLNDLIWNDDFRNWVLRPDAVSNAFWHEWLSKNPDKKQLTESAKNIILSLKVKEPGLTAEEMKAAIHKNMNEAYAPEQAVVRKLMPQKYWYGIAASVIFLLVISMFFLFRNPQHNNNLLSKQKIVQDSVLVAENNTGKPKTIVLEDGTKITLEDNSFIRCPASFKGLLMRRVYLTGDAFFEVAHDESKPFLVYAGGLITRVLGTKFFIHSLDKNKQVSVEVMSGVVAVYREKVKDSANAVNKKEYSLVLTQNQKANYSEADEKLVATLVNNPVEIAPNTTNLNFQNTSVDKIFDTISAAYGIDIVFDKALFAKRTFTAELAKESLYEKMDIITKALNARYEIKDGKIFVYAESQ